MGTENLNKEQLKNFIVDISIDQEYKLLNSEVWAIELGIRSICVMYDEHSCDKNSHENIYILKENITYRMFSVIHQLRLLVNEFDMLHGQLNEMHKKNPNYLRSFPMGNPHFQQAEQQISSIFDSLIFHMSSVFDYFGHLASYICQSNKSKAFYWTKLASACRGEGNEFSDLKIKDIITKVDREFVGRLYDYRARLIHNRRDQHEFVVVHGVSFNFMIVASDLSIKEFKTIRNYQEEGRIALSYLSSYIIRRCFECLEELLNGLRGEILKDSHFISNIQKPKNSNGLVFAMADPTTNSLQPISEGLWAEFIERKRIPALPNTKSVS